MINSRVLVRSAVLSAAALLAMATAACSSSGTPSGSGSLTGSSASPTAPATAASTGGTPSTGATATPTVQPGGPVPAGFSPRDLTFVGTQTGWLLGTAPCSSAPCTSIVHTTNGATSWIGLPTPRADLQPIGQNGCGTACIWGLRFASTHTGYAFGPTALYLTTNGGENWTHESGNADALEIANGTVLRISHTTTGCPPGCTYQISNAAVGSTSWHTIAAPGPLTGNEVRLLRTGHHAYLEIYQNPAGGAGDAHGTLLTSGDDGKHWTSQDDPCGTYGGQEADSENMAVASDGSLTILCDQRGGNPTFVITSTNGGASFGAQHLTPSATADAIGAASATTLLVSSGGTLSRSTNAGATWTSVATATAPSSTDVSGGVIGFETAQTGRWVTGANAVLTTTNAGATWKKYTFTS